MDLHCSPEYAPNYAPHRHVTAADGASITDKKLGMNMADHEYALVQVVPSTSLDASIEFLFWCEGAGKFISLHTPLTFAGKGTGVAFEVDLPTARGRVIFVKVTGTFGVGDFADVYVSGFPVSAR